MSEVKGTAKVTASVLNVRKGAGKNYGKLGTLSKGASVSYYGEQSGWLQIKYKEQTAFISGDYATKTPATSSGGGASAAGAGQVKITASSLNVRAGSNTNSKILGVLSKGAVVDYSGTQDGWYRITYKGETGFISGKFATVVSGAVQQPAKQEEPAQTAQPALAQNSTDTGTAPVSSNLTVYTTASSLNVRQSPKTGQVITQFACGTACSVIEEKDGWYKVSCGSTTGWISKGYTSTTKPKATGKLQTAYEDYQNYLSNGIENVQKDNSKKSYSNEEAYVISKIGQKLDVINRVADQADLPREVVAGIWYRESSFDQTKYLHNGDPLGETTTHVPKGIYFGKDEFDKAAAHALNMKVGNKNSLGLTKSSKDYAAMCAYCEAYNGFGYRSHGTASAYVSAGTSKYTGGMYVSDGNFSTTTKDGRIGVMRVFQVMAENYPR